jgi:hypothetical protein
VGREHLLELAEIFAVGVYAYAVMSNHVHAVLRVDPTAARTWSNEEAALRFEGQMAADLGCPRNSSPLAKTQNAGRTRRFAHSKITMVRW